MTVLEVTDIKQARSFTGSALLEPKEQTTDQSVMPPGEMAAAADFATSSP